MRSSGPRRSEDIEGCLTTNSIDIAGWACESIKNLNKIISGIPDASVTLQSLRWDVSAIHSLMESIQCATNDSFEGDFSHSVKQCLEQARMASAGCGKICDEFIKRCFRENDVKAFGYEITSYKATLEIALNLISLKETCQSLESVRNVQSDIEKTINAISGQIQGLEIGNVTAARSGSNKMETISNRLEEHKTFLGQCMKACISARVEISERAEALDKVGQWRPVAHNMIAIAKDNAVQMAGNISTEVALALLR